MPKNSCCTEGSKRQSSFFFASRGKLNNSCFLADVKSHLQRKNSQADEAWRMSSPTEHCRALQREEHQQPQQMHKNAWLRLLASLVCGHPQYTGDLSLTVFVPFAVISCKALVLPLRFGNLVLQCSLRSDERSCSASVPPWVLLLWCVEEDMAPELYEPLL